MCDPVTMSLAGVALVGGGVGAYSQYQAGKAQEQVSRNNAMMARWQAADVKQQGAEQAAAIGAEGRRLESRAAVDVASSGATTTVNPFSASAAAIGADQTLAKANAAREAWGLKQQARDELASGKWARKQSILGAVGTGMGGIGGALSAYAARTQRNT